MMFRDRFDDEEEDEPKESEFTLGLGALLGIFFGLVLLCGLFFGFGYTLGHGSSKTPTSHPSAATPESSSSSSSSSQLTTGGAKPAAQTLPLPAPANPTGNQATSAQPANGATTAPTTATGTASGSQPAATPPAAPQQTATHPSASPGAAQQVFQAAVPRTPSQQAASAHQYMVQVAAVSRPRDASVLVAALQQRGFQAVTRSEPSDHLMHVQIGPFSSLAAANQARSRLMADGYNAILKP